MLSSSRVNIRERGEEEKKDRKEGKWKEEENENGKKISWGGRTDKEERGRKGQEKEYRE